MQFRSFQNNISDTFNQGVHNAEIFFDDQEVQKLTFCNLGTIQEFNIRIIFHHEQL